jgi:hypothetical protein
MQIARQNVNRCTTRSRVAVSFWYVKLRKFDSMQLLVLAEYYSKCTAKYHQRAQSLWLLYFIA